jgi:hypothetical protein
VAFWERGFIAEVRAPLAVLAGEKCRHCRDGMFGYPGTPDCPICGGSGYSTPGIAAKIAREQPVTRWVATDKEPFNGNDGADGDWSWWDEDRRTPGHDESNLPIEIYELLESDEMEIARARWYPTREAAIDALSTAIATLAKQENARCR